jgi:hypothetical protein
MLLDISNRGAFRTDASLLAVMVDSSDDAIVKWNEHLRRVRRTGPVIRDSFCLEMR